jgi:hypothetical protein
MWFKKKVQEGPKPGDGFCADVFNLQAASFQAHLRWEDEAGNVAASPFALINAMYDGEGAASASLYLYPEDPVLRDDAVVGSVVQKLAAMLQENQGWKLDGCSVLDVVEKPARPAEWRRKRVVIERSNGNAAAYRIVARAIREEDFEAMDLRDENYWVAAVLDVFQVPEGGHRVTFAVCDPESMSQERADKLFNWLAGERLSLAEPLEVQGLFAAWRGFWSIRHAEAGEAAAASGS